MYASVVFKSCLTRSSFDHSFKLSQTDDSNEVTTYGYVVARATDNFKWEYSKCLLSLSNPNPMVWHSFEFSGADDSNEGHSIRLG